MKIFMKQRNPKRTLTLAPRNNQVLSRPCPVGNHPWGLSPYYSASEHTTCVPLLFCCVVSLVFWGVWDLNLVPHAC